jgi:hypothetical protein
MFIRDKWNEILEALTVRSGLSLRLVYLNFYFVILLAAGGLENGIEKFDIF